MYSATQLRYLKVMGIPAWEPRLQNNPEPVREQPAADTPAKKNHPASEPERSLRSCLLQQPLQQLHAGPSYTLGPAQAALLVLSDFDPQQAATAQPFYGAAGKMLDAMLKAIGQSRGSCQLAALAEAGADTGADLQTLPAGCSPRVILFFTRPGMSCAECLPAQSDQSQQSSILSHTIADAQCIVSYHPQHLLQHAQLKRQVWEDLKTVKQLLG